MEIPEWNVVLAELIRIVTHIGLAAVALLVGRWTARAARKLAVRALNRTDLTPSMTTILVAVIYYAIWLVALVAALLILGVPSSVVLTSVGLALVILAFSLQQSLRDLAAAVIFMIFKPFRLGDLIATKGTTGTVEDIGPFTTTLATWDGRAVVLPNSQVQEAGIINYSTKPRLVTDITVRIPFEADPQQARTLILAMLAEDSRVLSEPAPHIPVLAEDDSWVLLNVRAGVLLSDYFDLQDSLRERIRILLEQAGLTVPYPRREVHLTSAALPEGDPDRAA